MADPGINSTLRGLRVLIVEDEVLVAMELEYVLEQQGCMVLGSRCDRGSGGGADR